MGRADEHPLAPLEISASSCAADRGGGLLLSPVAPPRSGNGKWKGRGREAKSGSLTFIRPDGRSYHPMDIAVLTHFPSPYQVELFNAIAALGHVTLRVHYLHRSDSGRRWSGLDLRHEALFLQDGS